MVNTPGELEMLFIVVEYDLPSCEQLAQIADCELPTCRDWKQSLMQQLG